MDPLTTFDELFDNSPKLAVDEKTKQRHLEELKKIETQGNDKIKETLNRISSVYEAERYRLLQRYQTKMEDIHQREKTALKNFVDSISVANSPVDRKQLYEKLKRVFKENFF